jgi:hypothetical protein
MEFTRSTILNQLNYVRLLGVYELLPKVSQVTVTGGTEKGLSPLLLSQNHCFDMDQATPFHANP